VDEKGRSLPTLPSPLLFLPRCSRLPSYPSNLMIRSTAGSHTPHRNRPRYPLPGAHPPWSRPTYLFATASRCFILLARARSSLFFPPTERTKMSSHSSPPPSFFSCLCAAPWLPPFFPPSPCENDPEISPRPHPFFFFVPPPAAPQEPWPCALPSPNLSCQKESPLWV